MRRLLFLSTFAMLLAAAPAWAQKQKAQDSVPATHKPPAGMCRVWIDGVPPKQQAAPTDCATAVRNVTPGARVIFGDTASGRGKAGSTLPKTLPAGKLPPNAGKADPPKAVKIIPPSGLRTSIGSAEKADTRLFG